MGWGGAAAWDKADAVEMKGGWILDIVEGGASRIPHDWLWGMRGKAEAMKTLSVRNWATDGASVDNGKTGNRFFGGAGKNRGAVLDLLHLTCWSLQLDIPGRPVSPEDC